MPAPAHTDRVTIAAILAGATTVSITVASLAAVAVAYLSH